MPEFDRDAIIEAAKGAEKKAGSPISRADFERLTGISKHHIYRFFPDGGRSEVKRLAKLERHPRDKEPISDEELLAEFHRVASSLTKIPTWAQFDSQANISDDVVRRRFGGVQGTLTRYRTWLQDHEPSSPLVDELHTRSRHEIPTPAPAITTTPPHPSPEGSTWNKIGGPEFGPPIDFRGLRHAPINEQGVVFLFGMLSYELGFIVEAVHAKYPDCEAKRSIGSQGQRWQRIRIEFEYHSRNFRDHGHDPSGCDLIVCWEHNWPDCPIEVLELRSVIDQLEG